MTGLLMPVDYLAELAGADFAPDPAEYYNEDLAHLPPELAQQMMDPAGLAGYVDPVQAAYGPPVAAPGPQGAGALVDDAYFAPTTWQEDIANPVTYAEDDAWLPPPTAPRGY